MDEYFVIVFWGNTYYQYRLKDLLANSFNGFVNDEYAFMGINFYFPIVSEENQYYLFDRNADWSFSLNGEKITEKKAIKHGDYILISSNDISLSMLIMNCNSCTIGSKIYELKNGGVVFIGRSNEMNVVLNYSASISRKHASIRTDASGNAYVDDLSGKTGVYVNGIKTNSLQLKSGDEVFIMGTSIIYFKNCLIIPNSVTINGLSLKERLEVLSPEENQESVTYVRTPRIQKSLEKGVVEIDPPTPPQRQKEMPFILAAGPSLTMSLAMLASLGVTISNSLNGGNYTSIITSGVMAVSMLLGALLWPKLSRSYTKRQAIANEEYRKNRYLDYLDKKEEEIKYLYDRNTRIWNETLYPSPTDLIEMVYNQNRRLWERSITDEDFLGVRLGTGEKDFEVDINIKKKGFELEEDSLKEEGYRVAEKYVELKKIPITVSLKQHRIVGVVGDYEDIAKTMITNLVSLYAPEEVKIVLVYNRQQEKILAQFNDLPHMWSADMKTRYVATSEAEAYGLFAEIDEFIQAREGTLEKEDVRTPHFVVLVFDQRLISSVPFKKTLLDANNLVGVSTVFFGERFNQIPKECVAIIQRNSEICGIYIKNENDNKLIKFEADKLSESDQDKLIRGLSKVKVKREKSSSDVPNSISFLDVFEVGNVAALDIESHWNTNNSNKSLAVPIGVMAGNKKFYLDIHEKYHGCHGLVAGTTGSGKSEFLQAYILSMMINFSPKEVAFVLVDFKGGDMARPFLKSPHLSATISNLSGNTLYRALVSLEAEIKNRQRIFNESASKLGIDKLDINSYHKYFKENKLDVPLPHLIIVIDEFAQLKTQHPEFMAKLIDVAQVGRSLGIHLILATQKPSGVVDPQIWSNSRFKVCLKVMDKQDSSDMINRPVATMIKTPGRAYVQVGYDEIFELVQSGYSGAEYIPQDKYMDEDSITVSMVNWPGEHIREAKDIAKGEKTNLTQLEAVMKEMALLGEKKNVYARKLWLEPLSERLRIKDIKDCVEEFNCEMIDNDSPGKITVGIMDLPHIQKQLPYEIDFVKDGHLAIYGSSGTGKSTFVQSIFYAMAVKYSPKMFNSFVIDFNGGSLIGLSKMPHCVAYVTDESERKVLNVFATINQIISERREVFASKGCANYESFISAGGFEMPVILAVIDNYASFREKMYKCEDQLVQIIAAARACGIYFIVTGSSKGAIYYKVTDHISNRVVFCMNDTESYRDILNVHIPVFPENIKGRALVVNDKQVVEMQVAVPFDAESESARSQSLTALYSQMTDEFGKIEGYSVPKIKESDDDFEEEVYEPVYQRAPMKKMSSCDDGMNIGTDIEDNSIIGIPKDNAPFFICNKKEDNIGVSDIIESYLNYQYEVNVISLKRPYDISCKYIDCIDEFIYSYVESEDKTNSLLVIDGFADFFDVISDEALDVLVKAIRDGNIGKIITIDDMSRISDYCDTELYLQLVRCSNGMVMSGEAINSLAVLLNSEFYMIPEDYRKIPLQIGQAIVYSQDSAAYVQLGGV